MHRTHHLKPLLSVFLTTFLLLTACGSSQSPDPAVETTTSQSLETALSTGDRAAEATEPAPAADPSEAAEAEPEQEPEEPSYDVIPDSYACTIRVSINPQVLLYLDESYKVIGILHENEDAIDAYGEMKLVGQPLENVVDTLISTAEEKGYLKEDATVSITLEEVTDTEAITDDTVLRLARDTARAALETTEKEVSVDTVISEEVQAEAHIEKTMVTCPDCGGSGIFCPGVTPPEGSIAMAYPSCGGSGIVACRNPICDGGKCTRCGGSGKTACHGCNGAGVNSVDGATCNHCGGSGKTTCEYCHGTGNCDRCGGTGQITCLALDQHTECATCHGTGQVEE